jgi:hypothetical protein
MAIAAVDVSFEAFMFFYITPAHPVKTKNPGFEAGILYVDFSFCLVVSTKASRLHSKIEEVKKEAAKNC